MARPLRIEFPGATYHITARGDRREPIYEDDIDRSSFLRIFAEAVNRYHWLCHAYCLMTNHYHLIVETPEANLSRGMRYLNGVFSQASNRRHRRCGHLFQGRFTGILVDRDSYLLGLTRYVVLNPVRAKMVKSAGEWPWSSYGAMVGDSPTPVWLATDALLLQFAEQRSSARDAFRQFVAGEVNDDSIWSGLRRQVFLGDDDFVKRMQTRMQIDGDELAVPGIQRRPPAPSIASIYRTSRCRDSAIASAYETGAYTYRDIANHFGIHLSTVGRIVRRRMQRCEH